MYKIAILPYLDWSMMRPLVIPTQSPHADETCQSAEGYMMRHEQCLWRANLHSRTKYTHEMHISTHSIFYRAALICKITSKRWQAVPLTISRSRWVVMAQRGRLLLTDRQEWWASAGRDGARALAQTTQTVWGCLPQPGTVSTSPQRLSSRLTCRLLGKSQTLSHCRPYQISNLDSHLTISQCG